MEFLPSHKADYGDCSGNCCNITGNVTICRECEISFKKYPEFTYYKCIRQRVLHVIGKYSYENKYLESYGHNIRNSYIDIDILNDFMIDKDNNLQLHTKDYEFYGNLSLCNIYLISYDKNWYCVSYAEALSLFKDELKIEQMIKPFMI